MTPPMAALHPEVAARAADAAVAKRLVQLQEFEDDFLSSVSHELRTPITNIIGYTEMLTSTAPGPLTAEQSSMLERIDCNAMRLLRMIQEVLRSSHADEGEVGLGPVVVDLAELVGRALQAVGPQLSEKRLAVSFDLFSGPVSVSGVPRDLRVMTNHLLGNAIKFTPAGGRLGVTLGVSGDECTLVVADSGCGIPQDELPLVFGRFFRSSVTTHEPVPGAGLGLSTAQGIAENHGGHIDVQSVVGAGSSFTVHLPTSSSTLRES
jgi:signal transduction histidine kinase